MTLNTVSRAMTTINNLRTDAAKYYQWEILQFLILYDDDYSWNKQL